MTAKRTKKVDVSKDVQGDEVPEQVAPAQLVLTKGLEALLRKLAESVERELVRAPQTLVVTLRPKAEKHVPRDDFEALLRSNAYLQYLHREKVLEVHPAGPLQVRLVNNGKESRPIMFSIPLREASKASAEVAA